MAIKTIFPPHPIKVPGGSGGSVYFMHVNIMKERVDFIALIQFTCTLEKIYKRKDGLYYFEQQEVEMFYKLKHIYNTLEQMKR